MGAYETELRRLQWLDLADHLSKKKMESREDYNRYARFCNLYDAGPFCRDYWIGGWIQFLPEDERELTPEVISRITKRHRRETQSE
jgi:hypothetical protein